MTARTPLGTALPLKRRPRLRSKLFLAFLAFPLWGAPSGCDPVFRWEGGPAPADMAKPSRRLSQLLMLSRCVQTGRQGDAFAPRVVLNHYPAGSSPMVELDPYENCSGRRGLGFQELTCQLTHSPFADPSFARTGTYQIDIEEESRLLLVDYGSGGVTDSRASIELRLANRTGEPFLWMQGGKLPMGDADTAVPLTRSVHHLLWKQEAIWIGEPLEVVFRVHITCASKPSVLRSPVRWQVNSMTLSTLPSPD